MTKPDRPVLGYILKGYPRISETFISNEILLLERLDIPIHIISMRRPRESFSHKSIRDIKARVDYLPETISGNVRRLLPPNLRLLLRRPRKYLGALAVALRRYTRTRKTATFKHLFQAGYLVQKVLSGSGVTHLHAHFAHSPTSVAMFASRLSGLAFSFTGHAKDIYTSNPAQLREKISLAGFVVTCTEYNRAFLQQLAGGVNTSVHRIYHGIDLRLFSRPEQTGNPAPPYRLFTVARLTEKKGLPTVYRALKILRDQGLPFEHTLIGDGDDRDDILALIRELGLEDCAQWLGAQPHHVVLEHFRRSHLFVLGCEIAKNGDRDGIPNVLVESMAMGVPVVATDVSGIPELVASGETGLLTPPKDPRALADAMTRLLTDEPLRARVIDAALAKVRADFDNQDHIKDLADLYRAHVSL